MNRPVRVATRAPGRLRPGDGLLIGARPRPRATVYAQIEGTGSTWSELIVQQWIADVDANGMKVVYTGGGSTKGRKDFSQDSTDFAISEIPYQGTDERGQADTSNGRDFAYLPIVAGGTAFTYQLKVGDKLVRNLRLSGETIAKIFTNQITNWNDPAITKDNNGRKFPSLPITPVVRSDGSGTTAQFTTWLDNAVPDHLAALLRPVRADVVLPAEGHADDQPGRLRPGDEHDHGLRRQRDDRVRRVLLPAQRGLPGRQGRSTRRGYYVEPTQYNIAVALTKAKINQDKSQPALPDPDPRRRLHEPGPAGVPDLVVLLHDHPDRRPTTRG